VKKSGLGTADFGVEESSVDDDDSSADEVFGASGSTVAAAINCSALRGDSLAVAPFVAAGLAGSSAPSQAESSAIASKELVAIPNFVLNNPELKLADVKPMPPIHCRGLMEAISINPLTHDGSSTVKFM